MASILKLNFISRKCNGSLCTVVEENYIVFLHDVVLSVRLHFVFLFDSLLTAKFNPVLNLANFSANEFLFESGVDFASCLRSCCPFLNEPARNLGWASCVKFL